MPTTKAGILRREVFIIDGVRTPVGKFGRSLKDVQAVDLAALTLRELIERVGLDYDHVDLILYGHVIRAGTGMNTAKHAALKAGFPEDVDASNVDMVCASGMRAIIDAATYIASGTVDVAVAGGMESMSTAPFILPYTARWGYRLLLKGRDDILDAMINDGLKDPIHGLLMGQEADETAWEYNAPREELDEIALESHIRAARAWDNRVFRETTIPVEIAGRTLLDEDEGIRRDTSREKLARLPPVFTSRGPHTAGNSSQISDGAASILLASRRAVDELGLKPRAVIRAWAIAGVKPTRFPVAPVKAVRVLLGELGWSVEDVDLWENNEAFAINSYIMNRDLGIPYEKLNIHGGSIAIGHPLGSTGARITLELVNALNIKQADRGVASICHGLGGATALAVERL
ncbi:MAG: thiolase family protein [Desulfurococcales archaeon]|nr:thiolase family protein [Desulfurococcales archaeon]